MTTQRRPNEPELDESVGGFAMFQARAEAREAFIDAHWRTGFHPAQRAGSEDLIVQYILDTYAKAFDGDLSGGGVLLDIGAGSGPLCDAFTTACANMEWTHVVVDSGSMLAHLSPHPNRVHVTGRFPDVLGDLQARPESASLIVAYSVFQYVVRDMPPWAFVEGICQLLRPGAVAVIGDVPNRDKRNRHLEASGEVIERVETSSSRAMTDLIVLDVLGQVRGLGLDAFCLPQVPALKTWDHREDLWIQRPNDEPYLEVWK